MAMFVMKRNEIPHLIILNNRIFNNLMLVEFKKMYKSGPVALFLCNEKSSLILI